MENLLVDRALGRGLELEPLVDVVFFGEGSEGKGVRGVVLGEEVVHYGAGLGWLVHIRLGGWREAFTSARTRPVLGSSMTGAIPLRLMARKTGVLSSGVV